MPFQKEDVPFMILDFHMHAFPERIASKTIDHLAKVSQTEPKTHGNIAETKAWMKRCGIDLGVILPIATKPSQHKSIHNWAKKHQKDNLLFFGSVHPDAPDAVEQLHEIKAMGLYGVKMHPDYQSFFVQEKRLYPLYETMAALGLPLILHTGWDPLSPDCVHASSKDIAKVCDDFPKLTVIAAHMGGMQRYDEVEAYLVGKSVYFDTSMSLVFCDPDQCKRIIRNHGVDKILFGSDCPWSDAKEQVEYLERLGLSATEMDQILYQNAKRLLHLS